MTNERKDPTGADDQKQQEPIKDKPAGDPGETLELKYNPEYYDPELDPDNPEFDKEKFNQSFSRAREALKEALGKQEEFAAAIAEQMNNNPALQNYIQAAAKLQESIAEELKKQLPGIDLNIDSIDVDGVTIQAKDLVKRMATYSFEIPPELRNLLNETADAARNEGAIIEEVKELEPYIQKELKKKKYGGRDLDTLWDEAETTGGGSFGNPAKGSLFLQAIQAARTAKAKDNDKYVTAKRVEKFEFPIDKPNTIIWNLLEKDTAGQVVFNLAKKGSKEKIPAYYAINFEDLDKNIQITKRLTPFDKLTYIAIGALFNAGNEITTLSQIYYAMGYTSTPGEGDRDKIYKSIVKMQAANIYLDNQQEASEYKYKHFNYEGHLLPCEMAPAIINGKATDKAIHIFREPPLITFAKERNQIGTYGLEVLQAPVSKTDANLSMQDYLLDRITRLKRDKKGRILFDTLYSHTKITTPKQKTRAPKKVSKFLQHYKKIKLIKNFTMEKDGITIYF